MTDIKLPAPKFLYDEEMGELHDPGDYAQSDCAALYTADQVREAVRLNAQADIRTLIADDAYAMTFQSLGQYRSALLAALSAAPAAPQPARTALKQYDLEQSEDYRKGYDDGRKKGYEVGYRQATEHAAMKSQPTSGWTPTTEKSKNEE